MFTCRSALRCMRRAARTAPMRMARGSTIGGAISRFRTVHVARSGQGGHNMECRLMARLTSSVERERYPGRRPNVASWSARMPAPWGMAHLIGCDIGRVGLIGTATLVDVITAPACGRFRSQDAVNQRQLDQLKDAGTGDGGRAP